MTSPVKKLYKEAKRDRTFIKELKDSGEKDYQPSMFWDELTKIQFATVYMGYLVAKGKFKDSNYK